MSTGLLGIFFLLKYEETGIPVKELWFVLSFFLLIAGIYFLAKLKFQELNRKKNNSNSKWLAEIDRLKCTGERIRINLENVEIRSQSYQQEIINEGFPSRTEMLDGLYDSNRNYKSEEIQRTYIVFYKQYNSKTYKFISQATTHSTDSLKMYIEQNGGVDLYIDRKNPTIYYFEIPFG